MPMRRDGSKKHLLIQPQGPQGFVRGVAGRGAVAEGLLHLSPSVDTKAKCFCGDHRPKEDRV